MLLRVKEHMFYLALLLTLVIMPRLYFATPYLFDGDPVNYFLGAKNLVSGNGYIAMGIPVIWPVGYSLTVIPFLFFYNGVIAATASSIFFSALGAIMLYLIGNKLFSKRVGFIAALLLGFSETYFFNSVNVASDTHALTFILAGIYFFIRYGEIDCYKRVALSGLFFSLAVITRYQSAFMLLLPPVYWLWEHYRGREPKYRMNKRRIMRFSAFFVLGLTPFAVLQMYINYTGYGSIFPVQYFAASTVGLDPDFFEYVKKFARIAYRVFLSIDFYAPLGIVLFFVGIVHSVKERTDLSFLIIWTVLGLLPMMLYIVMPRYFFGMTAPVLLLMAAGTDHLITRIAKLSIIEKMTGYLKLSLFSFILLIIFLPYISQSFKLASSHKNELSAMYKSFNWIKMNTPKDSAVITQSPYYGHFNIWEATGQDVWVGEYYSERDVFAVFDDIDNILKDHPDSYLVLNDYWQDEQNLLMMYTEKNIKSVNDIFERYDTKLIKTFKTKESFLLWKLSNRTTHPDSYYTNDHVFNIYMVNSDSTL